jgi:UDP-glucose 4-epimerase
MARILVTGGAGFIGSNLCEALIKEGHIVHSLDNYSTGSIENHVDGVVYFQGDTAHISKLSDQAYDMIYHLGEYSRVEQSFNEFDKVWNFNIAGTKNVLEFAKMKQAKLIYAGSSTKFGDNGSNSSPYAWSKASNTQLVMNYSEWYGLDYAITYFYNAYGKREISDGQYATLIAKFKNRVKSGLPLEVVLPGTQQRNFTHIDDIVSGLIAVGFRGRGDGYGIGSPETFSVAEVAEMFKADVKFLEPRRGNRMTAPVISDKTRELGWEAKNHLRDHIAEFLATL